MGLPWQLNDLHTSVGKEGGFRVILWFSNDVVNLKVDSDVVVCGSSGILVSCANAADTSMMMLDLHQLFYKMLATNASISGFKWSMFQLARIVADLTIRNKRIRCVTNGSFGSYLKPAYKSGHWSPGITSSPFRSFCLILPVDQNQKMIYYTVLHTQDGIGPVHASRA